MSKLARAFLILFLISRSAAYAQEPVSFLNLVSVGDSIAAGFQNGVLSESGQVNAFPSLIARQARTFHFFPLIPAPGFGTEVRLIDPGPPPLVEIAEATVGTKGFPLIVPQNLAVPGHNIGEALGVRPDLPVDSLEDAILGVPILLLGEASPVPPLSQIELAVALQPTLTLFWLGSNDLFQTVISNVDPTPLEEFEQAFRQSLGALLSLTDSQIVVANLPDVTIVPFLFATREFEELTGISLPILSFFLGVGEGDFIRAFFLEQAIQILLGDVEGPLPEEAVLRASRAAELVILATRMNAVVTDVSDQFGFPVVEIDTLYREANENGVQVGGVRLTTGILGGLFGLDGIHPTNTGQAIVANAFIETINDFYGLSIPPVDVEAVAADDPLVFGLAPGPGTNTPYVSSMSPEAYRSFTAIFAPPPKPGRDTGAVFDPGSDPHREGNRLPADAGDFLDSVRRFRLHPGPVWQNRELFPYGDRLGHPGR